MSTLHPFNAMCGLVAALALLLPVPGSLHAETSNFIAVADTHVRSGNPTNNYGTLGLMRIASTNDPTASLGTKRAFIRFDLSSIPCNSVVTNARFDAYQQNSTTTGGFHVFAVAEGWEELTATWDLQPAVDTFLGKMTVKANAVISFSNANFNALVQAWVNGTRPNFGISLRTTNEAGLPGGSGNQGDSISSRENLVNPLPTLVVQFVVPPMLSISLLDPGQVLLSWNTTTNRFYQLQIADNPDASNWMNFGPPAMAATNSYAVAQPIDLTNKSFYRVFLVP